MEKEFYFTIDKTATAELRERGSHFISFAYPCKSVDDFKLAIANLKKVHPKATHHCFAYRLGLYENNFRSSDAGEPTGTAGKQILGQIDSRQLTDTLVVVVRYFGGTLLGVPGLIQAYRSSAAMVLQLTPVVKKPVQKTQHLLFDYNRLNEVLMILRQNNCSIISQEVQLFCTMKVGVPVNRQLEIRSRLEKIPSLQFN